MSKYSGHDYTAVMKITHHFLSQVFVEKIVREGFRKIFNRERNEDHSFNEAEAILTHFVLVPSLLDAHHEFVYPQPPFADRHIIK